MAVLTLTIDGNSLLITTDVPVGLAGICCLNSSFTVNYADYASFSTTILHGEQHYQIRHINYEEDRSDSSNYWEPGVILWNITHSDYVFTMGDWISVLDFSRIQESNRHKVFLNIRVQFPPYTGGDYYLDRYASFIPPPPSLPPFSPPPSPPPIPPPSPPPPSPPPPSPPPFPPPPKIPPFPPLRPMGDSHECGLKLSPELSIPNTIASDVSDYCRDSGGRVFNTNDTYCKAVFHAYVSYYNTNDGFPLDYFVIKDDTFISYMYNYSDNTYYYNETIGNDDIRRAFVCRDIYPSPNPPPIQPPDPPPSPNLPPPPPSSIKPLAQAVLLSKAFAKEHRHAAPPDEHVSVNE